MKDSLSKKVAIVGIGETAVGKVPGKSPHQLHIEAIKLAIEDSGIKKEEIDGLITSDLRVDPFDNRASVLAEYLGIEPTFPLTQAWGGQSTMSLIFYAASAIATGLAKVVLVACAESWASGLGGTTKVIESGVNSGGVSHLSYEHPYGPGIYGMFSLMTTRHMHEFGTTSEQMANIAVTFRRHASIHPKAQKRDLITINDVLNSRIIASPLHLLDCCQISDGGWAFILTSVERSRNLKQKPVYLLGASEGHAGLHLSFLKSLTTTAATISGRNAFQMAGVDHKDIDVLGIADPYTIAPIVLLEDLGFCKKGEGGPFVEGNRLSKEGELPTNTHGGLLSYCHAGRPQSLPHLNEVCLQLRGQATNRQVKDARIGLVHAAGGPFTTHVTLILGT